MDYIWIGIVGLAAGYLAKKLTPQKESNGWISSLVVGLIGAFVGKYALFFVGHGEFAFVLKAIGGSFIVLWAYHRYLADKLNLKI